MSPRPSTADLAFAPHDHGRCTDSILARAEELARARRLRLTPVRRRTLEILLAEHRAMGAYDVLDRLAESGFPRQPPVAYRALEFLVEMGLAHRIDALNAFAACMHPGEQHQAAFLICRVCGALAEVPADRARRALDSAATGTGFRVERATIEAVGVCPGCNGADSEAAEA